jgi:hypothetical protein
LNADIHLIYPMARKTVNRKIVPTIIIEPIISVALSSD